TLSDPSVNPVIIGVNGGSPVAADIPYASNMYIDFVGLAGYSYVVKLNYTGCIGCPTTSGITTSGSLPGTIHAQKNGPHGVFQNWEWIIEATHTGCPTAMPYLVSDSFDTL